MFKKGPDIDKKKLLMKASDTKKDSLTRLKHFKTLIEHLEPNELSSLFKSQFSFIYHTFIETFSSLDCNSKQRRDDLECILFILEKILIYNPELIKKRWQFYSITFVMQKLLHQNNTWRIRQEGLRLFILWYQILNDETNLELQTIFGSLVPRLVPQQQNYNNQTPCQQVLSIHPTPNDHHQHSILNTDHNIPPNQSTIKLCSIDPLAPILGNEQIPNDEISFYLDSLLQFMITQTTKPYWSSASDVKKNQEMGFSFTFNMFKKIYLKYLFPDFNLHLILSKSPLTSNSISQFVDESGDCSNQHQGQIFNDTRINHDELLSKSFNPKRDSLKIDLKQTTPVQVKGQTSSQENQISLSVYQAIVIRWITRIMRQDMIPGQDELIKTGSIEKQQSSTNFVQDKEFSSSTNNNSTTMFANVENNSSEMDIARRVAGTWPENIVVLHELFRRAFLNYYQPASMKRVVNVYKEWICNGSTSVVNTNIYTNRNLKLGYTSFSDLLQIFVINSSNGFLTKVHNQSMLEEQVEMCKRIMNIYRYMVMKIYMNTSTWEQLLNVMLSITEHLFPITPPEKKENTIGGRIAPAFFQTFIVSWIRANLYVHISDEMWFEFHKVMRNLMRWRELVEEWSSTMNSLTRVLVKHVYGLNLSELPLDKPQDRRRRPKNLKSFSNAEALTSTNLKQQISTSIPLAEATDKISKDQDSQTKIAAQSKFARLNGSGSRFPCMKGLTRSNSDGAIFQVHPRLYHSTLNAEVTAAVKLRKIKSEFHLLDADISASSGCRSDSPSHNDVMEATSLKDSNMIIENDHAINASNPSHKSFDSMQSLKKSEQSHIPNSDKCVLLGGSLRGWTQENSVIMWRRMLGLFGNINHLDDPENHIIAMRCLSMVLNDLIKTRDNLGITLDNQSTPEQPALIPPYTYFVAWLLEATNLTEQFKESRLMAYKMLCTMSIRRHDTELPLQYYTTFYEAIYRGLNSTDIHIQSAIIENSTRLIPLELPGCTLLVQSLFERSRSILLCNNRETSVNPLPKDQSIQILNLILSLNRPIKKLMVIKPELGNQMNLVASGDIKTKIFDTLFQCNVNQIILDNPSKCKSLCAMAIHIYQELFDNCESLDVERLFDIILMKLQDTSNSNSFRINCDLLRLFADYGCPLSQHKPALISSVIQVICQLIVRLSTNERNKEFINSLLLCLEDWSMAVDKEFLFRSVEQMSSEDDETLSRSLSDSLIMIILRSLDNVINDEQYLDDNKGIKGLGSTPKSSSHGSGQHSQASLNSDHGAFNQRDRTITNMTNSQQVDSNRHDNDKLEAIKLACKVSHLKLTTYIGHFPLRHLGASSMSCCINEANFLANEQELTDNSEVVFLVINETTLISFTESNLNKENSNSVHLIIRNLCGKYSWSCSCLALRGGRLTNDDDDISSITIDPDTFQIDESSRTPMKYDSDFNEEGNSTSSLSSRSSTNRDYFGDLLNQLNSLNNLQTSSPQSSTQSNTYKKRNTAQSVSNPRYKVAQAEETMIALLSNQRFQELNYCERTEDKDRIILNFDTKNSILKLLPDELQSSSFDQCRRLIHQLGLLTWEKRRKVESLKQSVRLLRELKNLDSQPVRETHKIAVIYVAHGQEDKNSILSNSSGSRAYEEFVSGLGWEVNLASHLGFLGGLQTNKSTGETSPYYCNSTTEVMFHVSTRMPMNNSTDEDSLNKKLRHLGNDEIHIVWSDHVRDYRRGIILTEFGDVIIVIYPMLTFLGYYRIQILCKSEVPIFGPLFDNSIVHQSSLASLVRATAINASRAKRLQLPYYQNNYEERARLIDSVVKNHGQKLSFEEFANQFYRTNLNSRQHGSSQDASPCCNN